MTGAPPRREEQTKAGQGVHRSRAAAAGGGGGERTPRAKMRSSERDRAPRREGKINSRGGAEEGRNRASQEGGGRGQTQGSEQRKAEQSRITRTKRKLELGQRNTRRTEGLQGKASVQGKKKSDKPRRRRGTHEG